MRKGIIIGVILVAVLVAGLLGACTKSATTSNPPATTTASQAAATTQAPATTAAFQPVEWKFQAHMAYESITTGTNLDKLMEMVDKNTNGRVKMKRYPNDSIVGMQQMLDGVSNGTLDIATTTAGHWIGAIPLCAVEDGLPGSWRTNYEMEEILWDYGLEDMVRQEYAKRGVYLLTDFSAAPAYLTVHLKQPVQSLADLKGKKIRAFGSYIDIISKLGASGVTMALTEVYSAISSGTLDGGFFATTWSGPAKMYEVSPYLLMPAFSIGGTHSWLVNQKKWDALPQDLKTIIYTTAKQWASWDSRYYNTRKMPTMDQMTKWGFKFVQLSADDQKKVVDASMAYWDDTAKKDPTAAKGVQLVRDYFKEIGRPGF
jgi:TRAP-type C4-dicarboxylate transport system substrate-binding protein